VFLDVTGHGHPDLLIAAGGVAQPAGDRSSTTAFNLNDGHGRFTLAPEGTLPADGESTGAVAAADFDGNGRIGVFVGAGSCLAVIRRRPAASSYRNVGGNLWT